MTAAGAGADTNPSLDRTAVLRGAGLILGVVLPVSLVARALPDDLDPSAFVVVVLLLASAGGGALAAHRARRRPLAHAATAGMVADAGITLVAIVRLGPANLNLTHAVFLLLLFQIVVALAMMGGEVVRRTAQPKKEGAV